MEYNIYKLIKGLIFLGGLMIFAIAAQGQIISTLAGDGFGAGNSPTGRYAGDNGPATAASFDGPWGIGLDDSGNVYVGDVYNNRIRKIAIATGIITTIAGNSYGYGGDGAQATGALLAYPQGVATDTAGNVYIGDIYNERIRKINKSTGIITTIAGTGYQPGFGGGGYNGDGIQATDAYLSYPYAIAVDDSGNVFFSDTYNNRIRKINQTTGIITTLAGDGFGGSGSGGGGFSGDGGQATDAELYRPFNMAIDDSDNIYIADSFNNRVRKVSHKTGIINTIAGNGTAGYNGDNIAATNAEINSPDGVTVDASGNVYIADQYNSSIRKVSGGIITTFVGTGTPGYNGDGGLADTSELQYPQSVAVDKCGNLYIADYYNQRVRKVTLSDSISVSAELPTICSGNSDTLTVSGASTYKWSPTASLSDSIGATVVANPTTTTTYTVTGYTSCFGSTASDAVVVKVTPAPPLNILPLDTGFCSGQSAILYVSGGGSDFIWTPATEISDSTLSVTQDSVMANPTVTTTYSVTGINSSGCASSGTDVVTVIPSPNKPTFTQDVDTLISSSKYDNQWYRNDTLLLNDTSQNLTITIPGDYRVVVNNEANGCSTSSDSAFVTLAGINQISVINNRVSIYPNPFKNSIFIKINSSAENVNNWNLLVTDVFGRTLYSRSLLGYDNDIDLSALSCGMYFITVINKTGSAVVPVVKQD